MRNVLYLGSDRGCHTRSKILEAITQPMTREEVVAASGLTYEQVRRQTKSLVAEGSLTSWKQGKQLVYAKSSSSESVVSA